MATATHPNLDVLRRLFQAMGTGDVETISRLQTDDFTLTVAGDSAISGTFRGPEAGQQFAHSMQLTNGQMEISPEHMLADDHVGVAFLVATARRPDGREIQQRLIHEVRFMDGKVSAIREWVWDQAADQKFWR